MRIQDDIDFTTLSWVKRELDETLNQARQALQAFAEDPSDTSQMRFCATYLHQVQGTLRMVELHGAAMAIDEMEQLAMGLLENEIEDPEDAYEVLLAGMVQLPDYLERLQSGHKDIPIVLLPLLNAVRAARGESELSEMAVFAPKLDVELPQAASGPERAVPDVKLRTATVKLRKAFEASMLAWLKSEESDEKIVGRMAAICDKLASATSVLAARRLWWIAGGVLHGARTGAIEVDRSLKLLFGKVDQQMKRQALKGEKALDDGAPDTLARQLLYFAANGSEDSSRVKELQDLFELEDTLPDSEELEHARGSMAGHNRALLDTVSSAVKEDLMRVKDGLDFKVRQGDMSNEGYDTLVETLERVADTLGMLALDEPRESVIAERDRLKAFGSGEREVDDEGLMDVASAMLYVEASLDDYIDQLGSREKRARSDEDEVLGGDLPSSEVRRILDALMKESSDNLQEIKRSMIEFIEAPWDHERVKQTPRLLEEIVGGLRMLDLNDAGDLLEGIVRFVDVELIRKREVPSAEELDTLADAVASIEYYLEAVREHRPGRNKILDVARASLDTLGYLGEDGIEKAAAAAEADEAEAPEEEEPTEHATVQMEAVDLSDYADEVEEQEAEASPEVAPEAPSAEEVAEEPEEEEIPEQIADEEEPELPPVEAPEAEVVIAQPPGEQEGAADISDDIDEEIREVFIEEVEEELATLKELYPKWRRDTEDQDTLTTIRRTFHTLKGSGRLVGALTIGEFAWQIENLLNRVLDGTREASPAVINLLDQATDALPELLANVKGEGRPTADIEGIKTVAERLAGGEEVVLKAADEVAAEEPAEVEEETPEPVEEATDTAPTEVPEAEGVDLELDV
ncbi:MAG: Hpt domain-containing protein, partial [Xanthomonadales bacterium]|nr:Hpt domain-containing protein [Xanthomonadales bacterium]